MSSKKCFRCHQAKPLEAFYRHGRMRDGRLNKCIECTKADVNRNRLEKIEYYRAYDRRRDSRPDRVAARTAYQQTDAYRISKAVASKKWDVANAVRKKASEAVNNAVRDGRLDRQPCFVCGSNAQAHHPDYSAPLAVSWLCAKHHAQLHKEHRDYLRQAA